MSVTPSVSDSRQAGLTLMVVHGLLAVVILGAGRETGGGIGSVLYGPASALGLLAPDGDIGGLLGAIAGVVLSSRARRAGWVPAVPFIAFSAVHLAWQGTFGFFLMIMMGDSGEGAAALAFWLWGLSLVVHGGGVALVIGSRRRQETPACVADR
jgi:hypothetical protein